jgi:hypothetical protein
LDLPKIWQPKYFQDAKIDELPVYLKELKDKSGALLNDDQKCLLDSLLKRHINTFSKTKDDLGRANVIKHKININAG